MANSFFAGARKRDFGNESQFESSLRPTADAMRADLADRSAYALGGRLFLAALDAGQLVADTAGGGEQEML